MNTDLNLQILHLHIWRPGLFSLFVVFCTGAGNAQIVNYREIFGSDWEKAEVFLEDNKLWMTSVFDKYNIDYFEAAAVVFPEIMRYSALRDKIEVSMLKTLYVNLGKDYANFSIGHFQMKPVFAEKVLESVDDLPSRKMRKLLKDSLSYDNIRDYRSSIVARLADLRQQVNYLVLFIELCYQKFNLDQMNSDSRLMFLATAYNTGFYNDSDYIMGMMDKPFFSTKIAGRDFFPYGEISLYWYKIHQQNEK